MSSIFESYKSSDKPELQYRIMIPDELKTKLTQQQRNGVEKYKNQQKDGLMLSEKQVIGLANDGREYYDTETKIDIPMNTTVEHYNLSPTLHISLF